MGVLILCIPFASGFPLRKIPPVRYSGPCTVWSEWSTSLVLVPRFYFTICQPCAENLLRLPYLDNARSVFLDCAMVVHDHIVGVMRLTCIMRVMRARPGVWTLLATLHLRMQLCLRSQALKTWHIFPSRVRGQRVVFRDASCGDEYI